MLLLPVVLLEKQAPEVHSFSGVEPAPAFTARLEQLPPLYPAQPGMSLSEAFQRVEPGQAAPAPPKSLQTWTQQTMHGLLGGMLYGGYRGLRQSRNPSIPSPIQHVHPAQRAAAFFVRESILTGSRVGLFVSVFSAAAIALQEHRSVDDFANYAAAGAVTCGLFGAGVGGWAACLPAGAFGAFTAGGGKMLHERLGELVTSMDEGASEEKVEEKVEEPVGSVERVINMYEASLAAHPLRMQREKDAQTAAKAKPG